MYAFFIASLLFSTVSNAQQVACDKKADIVVLSYDRPLQLYLLLESINQYVQGSGELHVICKTSSAPYANAYKVVEETFSNVIFHYEGESEENSFGSLLIRAAFSSPNAYLIFAVDDNVVKDYIDISYDIHMLEKTESYGFYYRLGNHLSYCHPMMCEQEVPILQPIDEEISYWIFAEGKGDWGYPNNVDMTLYAKSTIHNDLLTINPLTPSFELAWSFLAATVNHRQGLCYNTSKIVNLPLNRVQEVCLNPHMDISKDFLLDQFNGGLKIDGEPLFRIKNKSAHMEYTPIYIKR